jgi:hypothetical protein
MIKEAFEAAHRDIGHLPLHQQALAWGISQEGRRSRSAPTTTCPSSGSRVKK